MRLTVWCNRRFRPDAQRQFEEALAGHALVYPLSPIAAEIEPTADATGMEGADIAFGQPPLEACLAATRLRWMQVTSAGYTPYDVPRFMETMRARGVAFTTSSSVYADPCAQHVLAMMLSVGRQLLASYDDQRGDHGWRHEVRRHESTLLTGQTVLLLGYGAIARRLTHLLEPFGCRLFALRRRVWSERGVRIVSEADLTGVLPQADYVVNLLPDNELTRGWMNGRRFACLRPGARFYNVGRGTTVDQEALLEALVSGRLGAAYLDVTDPEPLPPSHPLWTAPRCYITPHTAGGRCDQDEALVRHFLDNLATFVAGGSLRDRIG